MNTGRMVIAQLLDFLPKHEFNRCVRRYRGNFHCRRLSCYDQFLCLTFAQLTGCESLRQIETCPGAMGAKLYHAGWHASPARSTLADANERRDWRIWAEFAQVLIARARKLYDGETFGAELDETAYVLDATIIDLCLSLFPWARFHHGKGAVKLHTQMDLRGNIPCVLWVSHARIVDAAFLDRLVPDPGAIYILDRGYVDFARLRRLVEGSAHFVVRAKKNLKFVRLDYRRVDKTTGLRSDQTIRLADPKTSLRYPESLRLIHYFDSETENRIVLLTDRFTLPALTVARLYKCRWQVRTVLQMDQATSENQSLLRHLHERRPDANLDRHQRLPAPGHRQERASHRTQSQRNPANSQSDDFPKRPGFTLFSQGPISNPEINVTKQLSFLRFNRTVVSKITITRLSDGFSRMTAP